MNVTLSNTNAKSKRRLKKLYEEIKAEIDDMIFVLDMPLCDCIKKIQVEDGTLEIINTRGAKIFQMRLHVSPERKFISTKTTSANSSVSGLDALSSVRKRTLQEWCDVHE